MTPERPKIPDWAQQERQADLNWIRENLDVFWHAATAAFEDAGRGAIVVDTTVQPVPGAGNPVAYFPHEQVEELGNEDTRRIVIEYNPAHEMVLVLLKSGDRTSTYRLRAVPPGSQEAVGSESAPAHNVEPAAEPELEPPSLETLMAWEAEMGCEAACPHRCWVEPDGTCIHGNPSWLLWMGMI